MARDVEDLYHRYGPMVLRRCRRFVKDGEKALDAMQDTFVQVLRHESRLGADGHSSLLYRIATNALLAADPFQASFVPTTKAMRRMGPGSSGAASVRSGTSSHAATRRSRARSRRRAARSTRPTTSSSRARATSS